MSDKDLLESTKVENDFEEEEPSRVPESIVSKPVPKRKAPLLEPEPEEDDLEEDDNEDLGNICQYCHEPQAYFTYKTEDRGWAECPNCGKKSRKKNIPDRFIKMIETKTQSPHSRRSRDDEDHDISEGEDEELFDTPKASHEILDTVLREYGVKEGARERIVTRAKRLGRPEFGELDRMLRDFNIGVNKKTIRYIVEEYFIALEKEEERMDEYEREGIYPVRGRRRGSERGGGYPSSEYGGSRRSRSQYGEQEESQGMSRAEMIKILDERDRKRRDEDSAKERDDLLRETQDANRELLEELRELRENPPESEKDPDMLTKSEMESIMAKQQNESMMAMLKDQLDVTRKQLDTIADDQKEERRRHESKIEKLQDEYSRRFDKSQDELRAEQRRADSKPVGQWEKDESRLIAEGVDKIADIVKERGSVAENLAKLIPAIQKISNPQQAPITSPPQEGEMTVADLMDPNFVK